MDPNQVPQEAAKGGMMKPLVDKVGVPLLWFGIGYLVATIMQKPKRSAT